MYGDHRHSLDLFADDTFCEQMCHDLEQDHSIIFHANLAHLARIGKTTPVDEYSKLQKIGQGTFGEVFKVRHRQSKRHFALKRIRMEQEKEGFPITALREIRILQSLQHENIVCLVDLCHTRLDAKNNYRPEFFLVFEFCDHDLAGLSQRIQFTDGQKKAIMKQMLTGLHYLHTHNVLHRDLKAANILIDKNGVLKIADFGLARQSFVSIHPDRQTRYTGRVVTLWYRPPEILLNDRHYTKAVDMWGAGCIMAELWTKYPIMQGDCEIKQLSLIVNLCGSINEQTWPGVSRLETYKTFTQESNSNNQRRHVKEKLKSKIACPHAIDLIDRLLTLNPSARPSCEQALLHDYFFHDPEPSDLKQFSRLGFSYLEFLSQNQPADQLVAVEPASSSTTNSASKRPNQRVDENTFRERVY